MGWYIVIKTIKGRQYRYQQRTWREGGRVLTESRSLGPVSPAERGTGGSGRGQPSAPIAEPPAPAVPSLTWLTTATFTQLRNPQLSAVEWIKPFSQFTQAGPIKRIAALDQVVKACGVKIVSGNKDSAHYQRNYMGELINMPPMRCWRSAGGLDRQYQYYSTLFHELAHWAGHPERTGRRQRLAKQLIEFRTPLEELVAETTTVVVMTRLGYPPPDWGQHVRYIRGWANVAGRPEEAYGFAMDEAERAAEFILSQVNTTQTGA